MTLPGPDATWRLAAQDTETVEAGPTTFRFVAPGTTTRGQFGLFESVIPAGGSGAMPHYAELAGRDRPPTDKEVDAWALACDQVNLRDWESDAG